MYIKIIIVALLLFLTVTAQNERQDIRFSAEKEAWLADDMEKSRAELLKLMDSQPENHIILYNIGFISYLQKQYKQAAQYFSKAIAKHFKELIKEGEFVLTSQAYHNVSCRSL